MADQQGTVEEKPPIAAASTGSVQEILLRITRWQVMIDKRLNSQMTLLEALESHTPPKGAKVTLQVDPPRV